MIDWKAAREEAKSMASCTGNASGMSLINLAAAHLELLRLAEKVCQDNPSQGGWLEILRKAIEESK